MVQILTAGSSDRSHWRETTGNRHLASQAGRENSDTGTRQNPGHTLHPNTIAFGSETLRPTPKTPEQPERTTRISTHSEFE